jgi:hypothetical protein
MKTILEQQENVKKRKETAPFGKMEVPPTITKKERFLCTSNITWTNFACQWT